MLYERMNKAEDARKFYRQAAQLHPADLTVHSYRLRFEESQRVLMEQSIAVSERAGQQWVTQLLLSLKAQQCGPGYYADAYAGIPLLWRPAFKETLEEWIQQEVAKQGAARQVATKQKTGEESKEREGRERGASMEGSGEGEEEREEQAKIGKRELAFLRQIQAYLPEDARDLAQNPFSPYFHQQLALYPESARAVGLLSAEDWLLINTQGNAITEQEKKWLHLGGQGVLVALKGALKLKQNSVQRKEALLKALETACTRYKKYLHTTLVSPEEHMRSSVHYGFLLHCGLQLLAEVHTECTVPTLQAQVETVNTCLSVLVTLLLKEKRHPNDYLEYYRPLNVYLRQSLRTQLVRYQEKDHQHYGFLESVLQTLNACPDESGERAALTLARKKWEENLSVLAESPLDDVAEEKETGWLGIRKGIKGITRGVGVQGEKRSAKGTKKEAALGNANLEEEDEITLLIPSLNRGQPFRLDPSIVEALLTVGPDYTFKPSNVDSGNHKVRRIEHKGRVFYIKADPEMPGMTYLMDELHQRMIGHGTCFSTIARLDIKIKGEEEPRELEPLALQISEAVPGDTLHTVLHHDPERLKYLDHQRFCELAFLAMLTNPEDGLPSNYIVVPLNETISKLASSAVSSSTSSSASSVAPPSSPSGAAKASSLQASHMPAPLYTLVSVDHDHALFPAYLYDETNKPAGFRLQLKTILFCFPQMQELIHPKAREAMLAIDALTLLRHFLQAAQQENRQYTSLFDASMLQKWHARRKGGSTTIPIPLKTGDAIQLYNKLLRLQKFLRQSLESSTPLTLMDCLAHIEPRVAMDYRQAFKDYPDQPVSAVAEVKEGEEQGEREKREEREEKKDTIPPIQARLQSVGFYPVNTKGELVTRSKAQQTILLGSTLLKQPAYKELADLRPEESLSELDKMAYQASTLKEIAQQLQSPDRAEEGIRAFALLVTPEHKSALINGDATLTLPPLAWEELSVSHQKELLILLQKNLPQDGRQEAQSATIYNFGLQKLQLRGCAPQALTLKAFMGILKQCPDLIELDLSNLTHLDETWISTVFNTLPNLQKLKVQHCPNLQNMLLKKPLNHLKELNLEGTPIRNIVINAPTLKYVRLKQCAHLKRVQTESRQLTVFDMRDCRELTMMGLLALVPEENVDGLNEVKWKWQGSGLSMEQENMIPGERQDNGASVVTSASESKDADFRTGSGWQPRFFIKARSDVAHFLHLVAAGKQDEAEAMLDDARKFYRQATQLDPIDLTVHSYRLRFEEAQRSLTEQHLAILHRSGRQWVNQLVMSLQTQNYGKDSYIDMYAQLPSLWRPIFKAILAEKIPALLKELEGRLEEEDTKESVFSPYLHEQLTLYPQDANALRFLSTEDWLFVAAQGATITEKEKHWLHLGGQIVLSALKKELQISNQQRRETLLKALEAACLQYKKYLHTALFSPQENIRSSAHCSLILHCGLQLLAEVHKEHVVPTLKVQTATVEVCLSTFVTLLLKEKRHSNDYLEYYRPLNVYLRQCLRIQLMRYQEKNKKHYAFLKSVLQTLNTCPDESDERSALTFARKRWEQQLSCLAEDRLDEAQEEKKAEGTKRRTKKELKNGEKEDEVTLLIPSFNRGQPFHLDPAIVEALLTDEPDYTFKPSNVESGNHKVRRIEHKGHVFYVKADPEMPGMTYLIDELHQSMIGHGTCFSTIARLDIKIKGKKQRKELEPLVLQISEAVPGDTLHTVLHHDPERLKYLDYQKFCELAFLAMLTNPEDGSPSNYIVMPLNEAASNLASRSAPLSLPAGAVEANPLQADSDSAPLYTLVSVDHDHALFPAYLYDEANKPASYRLQLKTILFCFPQMRDLIHPKAREVMLTIDTLTLLYHFLQAAQRKNRQYTSLFEKNMMEKWHARRKGGSTTIPIPIKTGDAIQLYNKLLRLQKFLALDTPVTLMDCLAHLEPRVAMDYRRAFKDHPDGLTDAFAEGKHIPSIQARLQSVGFYPGELKTTLLTRTPSSLMLMTQMITPPLAYCELADLKLEESLSELDKMAYQASTLREVAQQLQSPSRAEDGIRAFALLVTPEHKSALINGDETLALPPLAWEKLSLPHQKELLSLLQKNLPQDGRQEAQSATIYNFGLQKLQLRSCVPQALTLKVFTGILKQCPDLVELDLSDLPQLDETWVSTLLNTVSNLQKLTLQCCPNLKNIQLKKLLNHLKELNLEGAAIQNVIINAPGLKYLRLKQCIRLRAIQTESRQLTVFDMRDCRELTMMGLLNLVPEENVDALNEVEWRWQGSGVSMEQENAIAEGKEDGAAPLAMPVPESKEADFRADSGWQARFFIKTRSDVAHFLHLVGGGKQDEAEAMLKVNPSLVLGYGKLTDSAGRQFKRITAFQYALWALDAHMWEMLLKYFKEEHTRLAYEQLVELDTQGTEHGKEISWAPLIRALKTYNDNYEKWSVEQCEQQLTLIGQEQDKLAEHVVSEYCRPDRPFDPTPQFDENTLPRGKGDRECEWRKIKLKWCWTRGHKGIQYSTYINPHSDRQALLALDKTRHQQKDKLRHQLKETINLQILGRKPQ